MRIPDLPGFAVEITPDTQVGHYGVMEPANTEGRDTEMRCPLCDGILAEPVEARLFRVVKIVRRLEAIAQQVPDTHLAFECNDCDVGFTLPRERWSGTSDHSANLSSG